MSASEAYAVVASILTAAAGASVIYKRYGLAVVLGLCSLGWYMQSAAFRVVDALETANVRPTAQERAPEVKQK